METILSIAVILLYMLVSVSLHEAMHAYVSNWLGDDTARLSGRLSLNPIVHIDPFLSILLPIMSFLIFGVPFGGAKPVPFNPYRLKYGAWGSALVSVAGPLTNLLLAAIVGVFFRFNIIADPFASLLSIFVIMNIALFVFNMLPIPPLDGSRLLYALAPDFVRRVMNNIERFGVIGIFFIVVVFQNQISSLIINMARHIYSLITGQSVI